MSEKSFGALLRGARKKLGLKPMDVAYNSGISYAVLMGIERNSLRLSLSYWEKLNNYFNKFPEYKEEFLKFKPAVDKIKLRMKDTRNSEDVRDEVLVSLAKYIYKMRHKHILQIKEIIDTALFKKISRIV